MEFVCDDYPAKWYYSDGVYIRINSQGNQQGKIRGSFLPDPNILFERRKLLYPQSPVSLIKPQDATYKLWNHWNKINAEK